MSSVRDTAGKVGLALAGGVFRLTLYACVAVLIFYAGKTAYHFGYDVFNQQAMSPGDGQEVTVAIPESASILSVARTLESKGLIQNAYVFIAQEFVSNYHGKILPGTYLLSTAYTPNRILGILSGDKDQEGVTAA